jgi:TolA-binding protein
LAGSTRVLLAEILAEYGQADRAVGLLQGLADAPEGMFPPDRALLLLGKIHQQQGNLEQAREAWQRIGAEYPQSASATEANRLLLAP